MKIRISRWKKKFEASQAWKLELRPKTLREAAQSASRFCFRTTPPPIWKTLNQNLRLRDSRRSIKAPPNFAMPPKKATRPAQENISLGPQVRDGELGKKKFFVLSKLSNIHSTSKFDVEQNTNSGFL
jgi:hypothetical protein